jgi:hypothetical protein
MNCSQSPRARDFLATEPSNQVRTAGHHMPRNAGTRASDFTLQLLVWPSRMCSLQRVAHNCCSRTIGSERVAFIVQRSKAVVVHWGWPSPRGLCGSRFRRPEPVVSAAVRALLFGLFLSSGKKGVKWCGYDLIKQALHVLHRNNATKHDLQTPRVERQMGSLSNITSFLPVEVG